MIRESPKMVQVLRFWFLTCIVRNCTLQTPVEPSTWHMAKIALEPIPILAPLWRSCSYFVPTLFPFLPHFGVLVPTLFPLCSHSCPTLGFLFPTLFLFLPDFGVLAPTLFPLCSHSSPALAFLFALCSHFVRILA